MEESNVTIRKHCATDKIPSLRSLRDVVGSQYRQTERQRETDVACVNSWARPAGSSVPFIGPSSSCALLPLWPLLHFSPIQKTNFQSPSCFPLNLQHPHTHTHTPDTRGCTPSLSSSVHFLSAGQHCLLEEGENEEDPRPLPSLALGEVIRHHIISLLHGGWKHVFPR